MSWAEVTASAEVASRSRSSVLKRGGAELMGTEVSGQAAAGLGMDDGTLGVPLVVPECSANSDEAE